ncbi:MAG TPA: class I SAM-dependent methyltransferase [Magnetospirillaceae bacterium]|nr:class I SAM-dependent methyltransferase [Magnetospirillaceae bacterium]
MVRDYTTEIARDWADNPYYAEAEQWVAPFWREGSVFLDYFSLLDPRRLVELACGRGRHAAHILQTREMAARIDRITLVDVNQANIDACKARFSARSDVDYVVNSGSDLSAIANGSQTGLFCYDAMVHFEAEDVIAYLGEIERILAPGGRAVLHYSNQQRYPGRSYREAPHCRNFFSEAMMLHFSQRKGLKPLQRTKLDWGTKPVSRKIDALILLEKP